MRTRDEIEAALYALGWRVIDSPARTPAGWKATIQRGPACVLMTGSTEIAVLEDLLRYAQTHAPGGR